MAENGTAAKPQRAMPPGFWHLLKWIALPAVLVYRFLFHPHPRIDRLLHLSAVCLAIWFGWKEIRAHKDVLQLIGGYKATFPLTINYATAYANEYVAANKADELMILLDFLGTGLYSSPDKFEEYQNALERTASKNVRVRMLVNGHDDAVKLFLHEFPADKFDTDTTKSDKYTAFYDKFTKQPKLINRPQKDDYQTFAHDVWQVQNYYCQHLIRQIDIRILTNQSEDDRPSIDDQIYFWLIPRSGEMLFAFPKFTGAKSGRLFSTRDQDLISEFKERFDQKWKASEEKYGKQQYDKICYGPFF